MSRSESRRITQRQIAHLAGVSQATVSLVLNGRTGDGVRIPDETRERVLRVIEETHYVADPSARRLAGADNRILGVFTYEPAFPTRSLDFYTPLLNGIESGAEKLGSDLLLFTSTPVVDGRRRLFHERNRLRLADGVLLLGVEMDSEELARLVDEGIRAVAVGRRDTPAIPYVGIDYAAAAAELVRRAIALGHDRLLYLRIDSEGESVKDRLEGVAAGVAGTDVVWTDRVSDGSALEDDWAAVTAFAPSLLVVESPDVAEALYDRAVEDGYEIPRDLSIVALGSSPRLSPEDVDFTRLNPPRTELGERAVHLLARVLSDDDYPAAEELRTLLPCPIVTGTTLSAPTQEAGR
ncbi:LacI family transcriptional regulator [Microbacterium oleivorans]|uniref:LacI family transcriptional regulator n=1 Tax=Microbacterium oleivorans TaxID=273677 RepID=A0A4R5YLT1_9MICO|nr:LacI family transcriptional regulator [Microbacterium oleivorans]